MPPNNQLETALIAFAAAGIASFIVVKVLGGNSQKREREYPYEATFLQNARTRVLPKGQAGDDYGGDLSLSLGWTMEDALASAKKESAIAKALSPAQVLQSLQQGNSRFFTGRAKRPEVSAFERRALINQQFPSTAILGCADSRVPVEIVFDCGLGDMYVVRVAGNCLGLNVQGSLEYAVHHLSVKVLMVMGHEGCGAVRAARSPREVIDKESASLADVLTRIKAGLGSDEQLNRIIDRRARDREAVVTNIRNQVEKLAEEEKILDQVDAGKLIIIGAFYEISSGIVDFFMEISQHKEGEAFKPSPGVQSRYNPKTKKVTFI